MFLKAHNGSGLDSYVVLNKTTQNRTVDTLSKNGTGIVSLNVFNEYVEKDKKISQNVHFRCKRVQNNIWLKEIREIYKLQPLLLKQ